MERRGVYLGLGMQAVWGENRGTIEGLKTRCFTNILCVCGVGVVFSVELL